MTTRVGLAGYGMAGRQIHAPLLKEAGLEVVAVSTSNPERQAAVEQELPGATVVSDLDGLVAVEGLDLVVLATPSGDHAAHALTVIEAGLPVVVDKPLAVDSDSALEVVDAAEQAGVPLTVFQNRRYDAEHATLAEVVRSGIIGDVYRAELRWERWRPVPKERWREQADPAEGGGILLDLHSHLVDAAVQLFGEVETVYAELHARTTHAEDDAFLACRHTSGVFSHLGATSVSAAPGPRVRVLGSRGAFLLNQFEAEPNIFSDLRDDDGCAGWVYRGDERQPVVRQQSHQADFYRAVAQALASEDPVGNMPVDPRDAVHTAAVIDAARASAEGRRVVDVITPGERI
ncbi:Gfo/Idh/MocA family oxidoreductase [Phycicoccus sp. SLBN-51]|uniref:Gfo/Idh/MocA family protein n=1 Tax=Phycicoccus sp. SLBN-51 TaxID=2768447 RepID=UPI00114E79FE|nr:Gfo/Idh/MocA family oxidoreductase [Phycicoccus sp. SLBN-51]TQJ50341.1 putative dehydrogenase [Phycicoccus sp. SLBN-51]